MKLRKYRYSNWIGLECFNEIRYLGETDRYILLRNYFVCTNVMDTYYILVYVSGP